MKKLVLLLVFSAIALRAAATTVAPPAKVWDFSAPSTTGAGGADWLYAITQTSDGGYLAGGFAAIMGTSSLKTKASVLKLDPHRTVQWERLIGISGDPDSEGDIRAVLEAAPNLYIAAGDQHATGANSDGMIVTLDAAGTVLNKFVFTASQLGLPPNVNPVFYAIRSVPGGGYIVAGAAQEATP